MQQCRLRQRACRDVAGLTLHSSRSCHLAILTLLSWQNYAWRTFGRWHHRAEIQCWEQLVVARSTSHLVCQDVSNNFLAEGKSIALNHLIFHMSLDYAF